jgi:hypothetical protein
MAVGIGGYGGGQIAQLAVGAVVLGSVAWLAGVSARTPPLVETAWVVPKRAPARDGAVRRVAAREPDAATAPEAAAAGPGMVIRRVLDVPRPFTHGDYVWDEAGVPAGPTIVTVDLVAQTLSVFRGGYEIGTAVVMYGADEKPTPTGIFPITQKDADHVSNLYGAPMPYMLRLTNDGVSIHGSDVEWGTVTHGCIGVPTAFAAKLFRAVKLGDRVIVTRGEMLQQGDAITAA